MAMGDIDARHLVSRTGLGTRPDEIARLARMTRKKAVATLLAEARKSPGTPQPSWSAEPVQSREMLMESMGGRRDVQQMLRERGLELKEWWFSEMLATKSPFTERMTLFWHNHFTSSLRKVKRPKLLLAQNLMFRRNALGGFDDLLRDTLRDPAMLVYLDNIRNNAQKPNENLGRELLELFTLGEGEYGEADVKAAARALTGWTVNRRNGQFRDAAWKHDDAEKTLLGTSGKLDGDAIVKVLVEHPACGRSIARKLRAEFVTTEPSNAEIDRLAKLFRRSRRSIAELVKAVLVSRDFWAQDNRGTRIKSPVELLVGTLRTLELELPRRRILVRTARALGQDLFDPPNVKGWEGGPAWITSNTLLRRITMMDRAATFDTRVQDVDAWLAPVFDGPDTARLQALLLAVPPVNEIAGDDIRGRVRALLTDPTYQLG